MKRYLALVLLSTASLWAQSNVGELRLKVTDPSGSGVKSSVELVSEANEFRKTFVTDDSGSVAAKRLPFGVYRIQVEQQGFAPFNEAVEIRSAVPAEYHIALAMAAVNTSVTVQDIETLIDPHRTGSINRIGSDHIENRTTALPGRSVVDLVNSQPGWLYEGNAVLHPRGSEYQTQFVVDGIPLTDNRSPGSGPEMEADEVDSLTVYTAGIPAEYGRKMGGVIEVNTLRDAHPGMHGQAILSGGSFDTAGAFASAQDSWGRNTLGVSASGNMTARYLNPVVPENYTNRGTTGAFSLNYDRDFTSHDRLTLGVCHELSRYEIPNQKLQQFPELQDPPGTVAQLQTAGNFETIGIASYQHIFSPNVLANIHGMVRDNSADLNSNNGAWPIAAFLHNNFKEGYVKAAVSIHHGRHER